MYYAPGPASVPEYLEAYEGYFDPYEYAPEDYHAACADAEEHGLEHPYLEHKTPNATRFGLTTWEGIGATLVLTLRTPSGSPKRCHGNGDVGLFHNEYQNWMNDGYDEHDPHHRELAEWWGKESRSTTTLRQVG